MASQFTEIALNDPVAAVMLASGTLIFAVSMAVFGYLALGAAVDWVKPESSGRQPPQRG